MTTPESELKARYEQLNDESLLDLWRQNTLTETAKAVLQVELEARGVSYKSAKEISPELSEEPGEWLEFENNGKWVTVAQFSLGTEAHIFRARLEAENIPAYVADEHQITANWLWSNALGGVKVRVPEVYAERAYVILRALESGEYDIDGNRD